LIEVSSSKLKLEENEIFLLKCIKVVSDHLFTKKKETSSERQPKTRRGRKKQTMARVPKLEIMNPERESPENKN